MFTTTGDRKAQELLDHFERVRQFFLETSGRKTTGSVPVRIIVLTSRKDWEKYRINESAAAFFKVGLTRDFIVMSAESDEILETATHEFTHLIVRHSEADFPVWLDEGLADLYSTLRAVGDKVHVGEVPLGRALDLREKTWLTMPELFAVDHNSPHYREKDRAGIFYAQSWLLTHMVVLSNSLRPKFGAFLDAAGSGKSPEEAFRAVYGLTPAQVEQQLHEYYENGRINTVVFDIQLAKGRGRSEAVPATPVQQATCEGLLLAFVQNKAEAMDLLGRLARENPQDIDVAESAAEAAWLSGDYEKGTSFAEQALKLGSSEPGLGVAIRAIPGDTGADLEPPPRDRARSSSKRSSQHGKTPPAGRYHGCPPGLLRRPGGSRLHQTGPAGAGNAIVHRRSDGLLDDGRQGESEDRAGQCAQARPKSA